VESMIELWPHQAFQFDFDQLISEAQRQERVSSVNVGELDVAQDIHSFFSSQVVPLVESDDWVFESAQMLAGELVYPYFNALRLSGKQAFEWQKQLHKVNEEAIDLLARLHICGKAPLAGEVDLAKASDFIDLVSIEMLSSEERNQVTDLYKRLRDQEVMQLTVTLSGIRDMYEMALPRVFFVARRAMKKQLGLRPRESDNELLQPSDYVDWYTKHHNATHLLARIIGGKEMRRFYRVSRNVANHHRGIGWVENEDKVVLDDLHHRLDIHVHKFQQRYRYLVYLCDYGIRAILASFCKMDRGETSNRVFEEYDRTFPSDFPKSKFRHIRPYPV